MRECLLASLGINVFLNKLPTTLSEHKDSSLQLSPVHKQFLHKSRRETFMPRLAEKPGLPKGSASVASVLRSEHIPLKQNCRLPSGIPNEQRLALQKRPQATCPEGNVAPPDIRGLAMSKWKEGRSPQIPVSTPRFCSVSASVTYARPSAKPHGQQHPAAPGT